jgi:hypothetical protein
LRLAVRLQSSGLPCGTTTQLNKEQNLAWTVSIEHIAK